MSEKKDRNLREYRSKNLEELIFEYRNPDKKEADYDRRRSELEDLILNSCRKIINDVSWQYAESCRYKYPMRESFEEISQECLEKLYRNFDKWKHTGSFESWLRKLCSNTAIDWLSKHEMIGVTRKYYNKKVKPLDEAERTLGQRLGRKPTDNELAEELKWSRIEIVKVRLTRQNVINPISLDQLSEDDGDNLIEYTIEDKTMMDVAEEAIQNILMDAIYQCLEEIKNKYGIPLELIYIKGRTLKELADLTGINESTLRSRIRRKYMKEIAECLREKHMYDRYI